MRAQVKPHVTFEVEGVGSVVVIRRDTGGFDVVRAIETDEGDEPLPLALRMQLVAAARARLAGRHQGSTP